MARGPRDLCTIEEVKARLASYREPSDPTEKAAADAKLALIVGATSERIMNIAGREFVSNLDPGTQGNNDWPEPPSETREFTVDLNPLIPGGGRAAVLVVGDMRSEPTAVHVASRWSTSTLDVDLAATPKRVLLEPEPRAPWQPIRRLRILGGVYEGWLVSVTGRWGFPEVPRDIRQAAIEQAAVWATSDLQRYSETFGRNVVDQAGGPPREPRALIASVYDTCQLYRIPTVA